MIKINNLVKIKNNKLRVVGILSQITFIIFVLGYCFIKKSTEQIPNITLAVGIFLYIICNLTTKEKKLIGEILLIISIIVEIVFDVIRLATGLNNQICINVILDIVFNIGFFIFTNTILIKYSWKYNYILITIMLLVGIANSLLIYLQGNCSIIVALKYVSVLFTIPYFYCKGKEEKEMKEKNKRNIAIIVGIVMFIIVISGIKLYNSQFDIFNNMYKKNNDTAKLVYNLNKNNRKFIEKVDKLLDNEINNYIDNYKNDKITFEELESQVNSCSEYKDYKEKINTIKEQKEKLKEADELFNNKEYNKALAIYQELDGKYGDLKQKQKQVEQEIEKNNLKTKQLEEIKNSIKVSKVWTDEPNSAGGVDLYINWQNVSDKVIKYAYFTIQPYNSVNDAVYCSIRHYSEFTAQADNGPYSKGEGTTGTNYYWENAWYNYSIKNVKLKSARVEYMDGSELEIPEEYIEYIK